MWGQELHATLCTTAFLHIFTVETQLTNAAQCIHQFLGGGGGGEGKRCGMQCCIQSWCNIVCKPHATNSRGVKQIKLHQKLKSTSHKIKSNFKDLAALSFCHKVQS